MNDERHSVLKSLVLGALIVALCAPVGHAQLSTTDLSTQTPTDLANSLVGAGVAIANVTYSGADISAGSFLGGTGVIGFESGVVLSSGDIASIVGPNISDDMSTELFASGDADLDVLSGQTTYDATILEFDFVPDADRVYFRFVFASEEYNEYVGSEFNDVFAFFINDGSGTVNCAVVGDPSVPVSVNTINNGIYNDGVGATNPALYINNDLDDGGGSINTEMDGVTIVLTCEAAVAANQVNHIKMAIADASDMIYDSNVFIESGSFTTQEPGDDVCPLSQGYWKTHAEVWPVSALQLGGISYTQQQLLALLGQPVKGDASLILAKQLIAAKLNVLNGSASAPVAAAITEADALLTSILPMGVKGSTVRGQMMTHIKSGLDDYNNALLTPNCTTMDDVIDAD